jgi:protein TonB
MTAPAASVLDVDANAQAGAPDIFAGSRMFPCDANTGPRRILPALLLSLVLHVPPLAGIAVVMATQDGPAAFGDDSIEVDFVMAEAAIDLPDVPQPDEPRFAPAMTERAADKEVRQPRTARDEQKVATEDEQADVLFAKLPEPEQPAPSLQLAFMPAEAPAVVQEESRAAISDAYRARIARHLARFKRFPGKAQARHGRVVIAFDLSPDGRVLETTLVQSSGVSAFDAEAVAMIRRAEPYPVEVRAKSGKVSFVVPVSFRLRG